MSWVQIADNSFCCGRPPCPLCYRWADDNGLTVPAIEKIATDLWGMLWRELTDEQKQATEDFANKLHEAPVLVPPTDPVEPPPAGEYFDQYEIRSLEIKLKAMRTAKVEPPKPRVLSIDEIEDRKIERAKQAEAYKKAAEEKAKPLREFAEAAAKVQDELAEAKKKQKQKPKDPPEPPRLDQWDYERYKGLSGSFVKVNLPPQIAPPPQWKPVQLGPPSLGPVQAYDVAVGPQPPPLSIEEEARRAKEAEKLKGAKMGLISVDEIKSIYDDLMKIAPGAA